MLELDWLLVFGILYIVLFFVAYAKFAYKLNPVFIIGIWFVFWCFISCTSVCDYIVEYNYGRIYVISNIYMLLLMFVLFARKSRYQQNFQGQVTSYFMFEKIHIVATRICTAVLIALAMMVMYMLLTGSITLESWRTAVYASESDGGLLPPIINLFYFVFLKGYVVFDAIFEIINVLYKIRKLQLLPFVNILFFAVVTVNRIEIVRVVLIFILAVALFNKGIIKALLKNRIVRKALQVIVVAVIAVVVLRFVTNGAEGNIITTVLQTILEDFSLSFVTFDIFFEQYNDGMRLVSCNIFDILFGGIGQMLELITRPLFGLEFENYNGTLALHADYAINIGKDKTMMANAFYTMYYNLVNGGGLVIPYFVSGGFGIILASLYNKWKKHNSFRAFGLLLFAMHVVIMGVLRWEFYAHWAWVTLFLLIIFLYARKANAEER